MKQRLLVTFIVGLVILTLAACGGNRAQEHLDAGNTAFEAGNHQQAIAEYDQAIELDPEMAMAYYNRGRAYLSLGEYEKVIADLDRAIELDPEMAMAYNNRGYVYDNLGEYEKAIADYDRALELDSEMAMAYVNRAKVYLSLGEHKKAIADSDRAIELDSEMALAYVNRGAAYSNLGEHEKTIADCDRAVDLDPEIALAYGNRGGAYLSLGEHEKAIADCDRAIELDPEMATAYVNRGAAYFSLGEYEKALADCDRAIELDPEMAMAYGNRGAAYYHLGEYEKAIADLERVLELTADPAMRQQVEAQLQSLQEPTPEPTPEPEEKDEEDEDAAITLQTYEHPDGAFTLDYPEGWEAMEEDGIVMFVGPESQTTGQMIMVMYGSTEQLFENSASESLSEVAAQMADAFWEGVGEYDVAAEEQISEERVYLSTIATDRNAVVDLYVDQAEDMTFVLVMSSIIDSDFYQRWDEIVESYTIHPEAEQVGNLGEVTEEEEEEDDEEKAAIALQTYEHPDGIFSIDYPEGWEVTEEEGRVGFSRVHQGLVMVMFGPAETMFMGLPVAEFAEQTVTGFWIGMGMEHEIVTQQDISEDLTYISATAPDDDMDADFYFEKREEAGFLLILAAQDAAFQQTWDSIVESYTVHPEAVE